MVETVIGLLCLVTVLGALSLLFYLIYRVTRGRGASEAAVRRRLLHTLEEIRNSPDPVAALDAMIGQLRGRDGAVGGDGQAVPAAGAPAARIESVTATQAAESIAGAAPTVVRPRRRASVSLDNITLLLYLGAVLVVIGAAVFIGGSWSAISGTARALVVFAFALGFLVVGELFVRATTRLRDAGQTFRSVGVLLLPFSALAYARFVLDGGDARYWAGVGVIGLAFYALWYRFSGRNRLAVYLMVWAAGLVLASLPAVLGVDSAWGAPALALLAGALIVSAAARHPDGRALIHNWGSVDGDMLTETLVIGGLIVACFAPVRLSWAGGVIHEPTWAATLVIYTLIAGGIAFWLRNVAPTLVAALFLVVTMQFIAGTLGADIDLVHVYALGLTALLLVGAAFGYERRVAGARTPLLLTALATAILTSMATFVVDAPRWFELTTAAAYLAIGTLLIVTTRHVAAYALGFVLLHLAILDVMARFPSDRPTLLAPTTAWALLTLLWAGLRLRQRTPMARRGLFIALAADTLLAYAFLLPLGGTVMPVDGLAPVPPWPSVLLGGLVLAGWLATAVATTPISSLPGRTAAPIYVAAGLTPLWLYLVARAVPLAMPFFLLSLMTLAVVATLLVTLRTPQGTSPVSGAKRDALLWSMSALAWLTVGLSLTPLQFGLAPGTWDTSLVAQTLLGLTALLCFWLSLRGGADFELPASVLFLAAAIGWTVWVVIDYLPAMWASVPVFALALLLLLLGRWLHDGRAQLYTIAGFVLAFFAAAMPYLSAYAARGSIVSPPDWSVRFTLLATSVLYIGNGVVRRRPWLMVAGVFTTYLTYGMWAADTHAEMQLFSAPLALAFLICSWITPEVRRGWEAAAVLALLGPAAIQMIGAEGLLYALLPGVWGVGLLVLGMLLSRRILLLGGVIGVLLPALYQLVKVAADLPPAVVITVAGLVFMVIAVLLTLNRERLLRVLRRWLQEDEQG